MLYDIEALDSEGKKIKLEEYAGKVLLIVNTATKCGFTPQYEGLEALYKKYKDKGFEILDFPCNQFGHQAPGPLEEINQFCALKYGTSFKRFEKIDVNGEHTHSLYKYLKSQEAGLLGDKIKWNFTKFLIDREGNVVDRFAPTTKPEQIESKIEELL